MTDSPVRIRPATAEDMPAAGRLGAELLLQHHSFDPLRFMAGSERAADGYAQFLGSQLEEQDAVILVAEQQGEVRGYVYAALEPRNWKELREAAGFLHDVVVDRSLRRHGVATQLVEAACSWLARHGAPRVLLWSATQNASAQALFDKLGFRRTMVEMTREL